MIAENIAKPTILVTGSSSQEVRVAVELHSELPDKYRIENCPHYGNYSKYVNVKYVIYLISPGSEDEVPNFDKLQQYFPGVPMEYFIMGHDIQMNDRIAKRITERVKRRLSITCN